jgi:phosphoribosylformylglycinamidine synthase subunit PurS
MKHYTAHISVMPLKEILDPQGKAVESGLHNLGLSAITQVRIGKQISFQVSAVDKETAESIVNQACQQLLANPIMEDYNFHLQEN